MTTMMTMTMFSLFNSVFGGTTDESVVNASNNVSVKVICVHLVQTHDTRYNNVHLQVPQQVPKKLQSWSDKVVNATSADQITVDVQHKCQCRKPCCLNFLDSYKSSDECERALMTVRCERTADTASEEGAWLFRHLYSCRTRSTSDDNTPSCDYTVLFYLDGVTVCEEYFTVALGFNYPNRRIQRFVREIQV